MDSDGRRHLRKAARTRDESHQDRKFREALAQADADKAEANRKADQVKAQKAAKREETLKEFKPILSLSKLKEMTVEDDRLTRIRQQLTWHRDIGKDVNLKGIHKMKKEEAWTNMIHAVQRHCKGIPSPQGMQSKLTRSSTTMLTSNADSINDVSDVADMDNVAGADNISDTVDVSDADVVADDDILLDVDHLEISDGEDDTEEETRNLECKGVGVDPVNSKCPTTVGHQQLPTNLGAGCAWDANDYSCAFDTVFMVFYFIYGQSSHTWRNIWKAESPQWNIPLGNLFDFLLFTAVNNDCSPQESSSLFSRCRDTFQDQVTESNPSIFPRGCRFAPASDILQRILGGANAEPLARQDVVCTGCGTEKNGIRHSLSYLALPFNLNVLRRDRDPVVLPLQLALTRYIERYSTEPILTHGCHTCQAKWSVSSFRLIETSWTWFEVVADKQSVVPSLELSYRPLTTQRTHTLEAIIYLGGGHFTARTRSGQNTWWGHDGQWKFGKPQSEVITDEEELRCFGGRVPVFLIYRRCDADG